MIHVGWVFAAMAATLAVGSFARWPLPINLILAAMVGALLAGFGVPFRHLVEGGFGYLNLIMALFAGAFFGQVVRHSGAADALAQVIAACEPRILPLLIAGLLLFMAGMFTGIAGVAVLAMGAFAAPLLRRAGLTAPIAAAYIAVMGTLGMIAPPLNVPAMVMADGVNMPFAGFAASLWALSLPPALFALVTFARRGSVSTGSSTETEAAPDRAPISRTRAFLGASVVLAVIGFWAIIRYWPGLMLDPSIPLVLVIASLVGIPVLSTRDWTEVARLVFSGTPLLLAAILVAVGVLVQIMTLTGVRGWLVIHAMSFQSPWLYGTLIGIPILGSVLTAIGTANTIGVPFAFAFIHQDMILNISALSAICALSEFCPPTAISTVLAAYVVGEERLWPIIRAALPTLAVMTVLALLMLIFAPVLAPYLR
jgi:TRAP-type C4-dicarboxylate transport system permease large subunit